METGVLIPNKRVNVITRVKIIDRENSELKTYII